MDTILALFFQNQGTFFNFLKKTGRPLPLPLNCASMNVAEYASVSLNIPKYP